MFNRDRNFKVEIASREAILRLLMIFKIQKP